MPTLILLIFTSFILYTTEKKKNQNSALNWSPKTTFYAKTSRDTARFAIVVVRQTDAIARFRRASHFENSQRVSAATRSEFAFALLYFELWSDTAATYTLEFTRHLRAERQTAV